MLRRLPDLFVAVGVLVLTVAIGEGRQQSALARDRRDPLLWQIRVLDSHGDLLRERTQWGAENEVMSLIDPTGYRPRLGLQLLPLGLPDGDLDLELHLTIDGKPLEPLQGLHLTPGKPVELDVPGQPLHIELRAVHGDPKRPLVS